MHENDAPDSQTRIALSRMSDLLGSVAADMGTVSELVSELVSQSEIALTTEQISQLQKIDHVCQSLQDLAIVSKSLATGPGTPETPRGTLQLAETRSILSLELVEFGHQKPGTIDLF